jgi:hypothetical protein
MDWVNNLTAGLVSGMIVSFIFYCFSGRQLAQEAAKLRKLNILIIQGMEEGGLVAFTRDDSGEPIGLVFHSRFLANGASTMSATASVEKNAATSGDTSEK